MAVSEQQRVLIVDDETTITDSLVKIFTGAGYMAVGVYSAEEAQRILPEFVPNLAILDVHLPKMNGIDLAILMRAEYPACRIKIFSGQIQTAELLEAASQEGHVFDILAKPVHPAELLKWAAD